MGLGNVEGVNSSDRSLERECGCWLYMLFIQWMVLLVGVYCSRSRSAQLPRKNSHGVDLSHESFARMTLWVTDRRLVKDRRPIGVRVRVSGSSSSLRLKRSDNGKVPSRW